MNKVDIKLINAFLERDRQNIKADLESYKDLYCAAGAGKTTAMRMLCGLSYPSSGSGTVAGYDVMRECRTGPGP